MKSINHYKIEHYIPFQFTNVQLLQQCLKCDVALNYKAVPQGELLVFVLNSTSSLRIAK
jgi:hypothetical protein